MPFCPESALSGHRQHRLPSRPSGTAATVPIPADWAGRRVLLHFQAVDHDATVWVDGVEVGRHRGGFTPFSCRPRAGAAGRGDESRSSCGPGTPARARSRAASRRTSTPTTAALYTPHHRHLADGLAGAGARDPSAPAADHPRRRQRRVPARACRSAANAPAGTGSRATVRDAARRRSSQASVRGRPRPCAPAVTCRSRPTGVRLWSPEDPHLYDLRARAARRRRHRGRQRAELRRAARR